MKFKKSSFTLVELIIVIAIIAVLAVISVMVISEWMGKSRDTRRLGDLSQIEKSLELGYVKNGIYPTPDSYVSVSASGVVIGYQGKFCDGVVSKTPLKSIPKDPLDDICYSYYVNTGTTMYQVMTMLENNKKITAYNGTRNPDEYQYLEMLRLAQHDELMAADYSKRYSKVSGQKLGILVISGTNQPIEEIGTGVDLLNAGVTNYISYFTDNDIVSGTGGQLISTITMKNPAINTNTGLVNFDSSLVGYWDMESIINSGGVQYLKDFSKYGNNGLLSGGIIVGGVSGFRGNSTYFDGVDDLINLGLLSGYNFLTGTFFSCINEVKVSSYSNIWSNYLDANNRLRLYIRSDGNLIFFGKENGINVVNDISNNTYSRNSWICITVTYSNGTAKLYNNGQLLNSGSFGLITGAINNHMLGKVPINTTDNYKGSIDEVRIYNRALSDSEIQALYNSTK